MPDIDPILEIEASAAISPAITAPTPLQIAPNNTCTDCGRSFDDLFHTTYLSDENGTPIIDVCDFCAYRYSAWNRQNHYISTQGLPLPSQPMPLSPRRKRPSKAHP